MKTAAERSRTERIAWAMLFLVSVTLTIALQDWDKHADATTFVLVTRPPETVPVYRFWSAVNSVHFYTISESEKAMLIRDWPAVWTFEGIAYYAWPVESEVQP